MRMKPELRASAALLTLSALILTACSTADDVDEAPAAPFAAVSTDGSEEPGDAQAAAGDQPVVAAESNHPALSEEEILEVLLDEEDMPLEVLQFAETTGTQYFHDRMGVNQGDYVEGFGESECAAAMDAVNVDLIGEDPESGVIREVGYEEGSMALWMLGYDRPAESATVWQQLLESCEGSVLENESEVAEFGRFAHGAFSGMTMQMHLADGSVVEGWFVTRDYGNNLVMISALNLDQPVFEELVEAQGGKLDALG